MTVSTTDKATLTFGGAIASNTAGTGINISGSSGSYSFNGTNAFTGAGRI